MENEIFIKEPNHKTNLKLFQIKGFVYLSQNNIPTEQSNDILWLDKFKVMSTSRKKANDLLIDYLNKKYPEYKGYIKLY